MADEMDIAVTPTTHWQVTIPAVQLPWNNIDADITPTVQVLKEAFDDADNGAANNDELILALAIGDLQL